MATLTLKQLQNTVQSGAALRSQVRLQPAGGEGDKVFPPTYSGSVYANETRRLPGYEKPVGCVLLDSVQSQANRIEEALQDAVDAGRIQIPVVEVDFSKIAILEPGQTGEGLFEPIGRVTSLDAPHRVADAILRDSELDGQPFRETSFGKKIGVANLRNATPLFEICPTALLLGLWDSTGPKGGLGTKFQRALVSEIIGVDVSYGINTSSRIDPLGIRKDAAIIYETSDRGWTMTMEEAAQENGKAKPKGKDGKPSRANHGNIVPSFSTYTKSKYTNTKGAEVPDPLRAGEKDEFGRRIMAREDQIRPAGVTIAYAEQTTVISLPALRRLQFPLDGKVSTEVNRAGQTVLAALGLCGAVLAAERGLDLRSRCLLWPTGPLTWKLLDRPGKDPYSFELGAEEAIQLLAESVKQATKLGLPWLKEPLRLTPAKKLVQLVRKSQELAIRSGDGGEGGE